MLLATYTTTDCAHWAESIDAATSAAYACYDDDDDCDDDTDDDDNDEDDDNVDDDDDDVDADDVDGDDDGGVATHVAELSLLQ